jgi:hypothetical protein
VTDHLVPAELVEGQREDERLRDRLDGEGELGISGGDDAAGRPATATASRSGAARASSGM